jgi:aminoglycoside phosphotransferase (APT) family kinase protein
MESQTLIEPHEVLAALGLTGAILVEPVRGGADAAIWRVERGADTYALRVLRPEQARQARREIASMTAASTAGIPTPRIVATATWQDRPAMLLEWRPGRTVAEELRDGIDEPERAHALGVEFGRVQAAIHALAAPAELPELPAVWQTWIGPDPELAATLARVPRRSPVLLHLDYHPLNVLAEGERITAVLDWANAGAGDPRADLARTLAIVRLAPVPETATDAARALRRAFAAGIRASGGTDRRPDTVPLVGRYDDRA